MRVEVIIAGGGKGRRFGDTEPKQFCLIAGRPILEWTIDIFDHCPLIKGIVLVVPQGMLNSAKNKLSLWRYKKIREVIEGGEERIDSVFKGLSVIESQTDIVLVHDGVRPLASQSLVESVIRETQSFGAVTPGIPLKETVKEVKEDKTVLKTLPRDRLYLIQTPQGFRLDILKIAHREARSRNWKANDDAALVEKLGVPVKVIPGEEKNIKITTSFDFQMAKILLEDKNTCHESRNRL